MVLYGTACLHASSPPPAKTPETGGDSGHAPNEVHCFRDRGHYIIHFQNLSTQSFLMDNAMVRY